MRYGTELPVTHFRRKPYRYHAVGTIPAHTFSNAYTDAFYPGESTPGNSFFAPPNGRFHRVVAVSFQGNQAVEDLPRVQGNWLTARIHPSCPSLKHVLEFGNSKRSPVKHAASSSICPFRSLAVASAPCLMARITR